MHGHCIKSVFGAIVLGFGKVLCRFWSVYPNENAYSLSRINDYLLSLKRAREKQKHAHNLTSVYNVFECSTLPDDTVHLTAFRMQYSAAHGGLTIISRARLSPRGGCRSPSRFSWRTRQTHVRSAYEDFRVRIFAESTLPNTIQFACWCESSC